MREGLRSRSRPEKGSGGGGGLQEERVASKVEPFDLGDESLVDSRLKAEKKGEVESGGKVTHDLDLNVSVASENGNDFSGGGSIEEAEVDRKGDGVVVGGRVLRSRSKRGDDKKSHNEEDDDDFSGSNRECGGVERIKVEEGSEGTGELFAGGKEGGRKENEVLSVGGRVLRSRSKRGDDKKSYNEKNDDDFSESSRECGRVERIKVEEDSEGTGELFAGSNGDDRVKVKKEENDKVELKRKRGRPPKTESKERKQVQLVDRLPHKLPGKHGRKRGRPPKDGNKNHLPTVVHNDKGKPIILKQEEDLTMSDGANVNAIDDMGSRRSSGKELEGKGFSSVKKNKLVKVLKNDKNGTASPLRPDTVNATAARKGGKIKEKQLIRDKIMEQLTPAGWTVDYRPRNGRSYDDAVYVSPDGKTHWSVTLAYNRLKKHYEAGDGEGKVYRPGFKFTPLPEEEINSLTRVVTKTRNDKSKPRKDGKKVGGVNRKEKKEKPGSGAGMGKSVKGKMKRKRSLLEEGKTRVTSPNRMPVLVRDHKRRKTQNKKRALLVRNAEEEIDSENDGYVPYSGKRTLLAWMIDLGTVLQNGKVHYMQPIGKFEGKITGEGIQCGCCDKILTISDFEAHAERKHIDPLKNIYLEEGTSLLQCLLDSWNKQDESERKGFRFVEVAGEDPNDDTCGVCGDGGDLICCDACPSTFHQSCLDIKKFPSGDWHCVYCCCKFCGLIGGCSNQSDVHDDFTASTLLTCHLCERKYHRSCIEANGAKSHDLRDTFCGNRCQELSERLEMLLGVKYEIEDGFSWSFIRRSDVGFDASQIKSQIVERNSKLAVALSIMDECFMPYVDHRSGSNLIHSILYNCGSNFKRLDYSGFVTAILERGDEIICAASIRIHGNELAEMPFIGTRYMYRRQGMCRRLLNAIERALGSLNVELLVIPAISELKETWTSVFGFEPLEPMSKQITKNMSLLVFPHVDMLQKKISKHKFDDEILIPTEVSHLKKNHTTTYIAENKDGVGSSGSDLINSTGIPRQIKDKIISVESDRQLSDSENNEPYITSSTIHHSQFVYDVTSQVVCEALNGNLAGDDKSTANACEYVTESCCQSEDTSRCKNGEKPIDLNSCCVPDEDRHFLSLSGVNTEAPEGHQVGALLEVTENFPHELKVSCEVSNNSVENPASCGAESFPTDSQTVFTTTESKVSADTRQHDSHEISDSCELRSKTSVQPNFIGPKVLGEPVNDCGSHSIPNGDLPANCEKDSSAVSTPNAEDLQTNVNPGNCQSIPVSSGVCEKIADDVDERDTTSVEANLLPANTDIVSDNQPEMKGSSELAEPDLQVDQTAQSNGPSSCHPDTASGSALHWASAGNTSCGTGGTEGRVLSNQVS
ncbi:hypothetical protein OROGR_032753 [Orobanche gracilis]